ncbi:hypothetical protein OOJ91_13875 [Micromonospora lupini]|uniref:hypothetical protein n=1 Tax=Micromonospora lupini TaxID=285679 RepID=UPI00224FE57B|nr:hypothetical protein [Micromonospora lupini]MCX5066936.1 hypothetical protein [Micromonospora lupini]
MTVPEVSPYDELRCPMPQCDELLFLRWELVLGLSHGSLTDAPALPADAEAGTWYVECLAGHRPLVPAPIVCPCGRDECTEECNDADVDSSDELRTFRAADLARLRDLIAQLTEDGGL